MNDNQLKIVAFLGVLASLKTLFFENDD